MLSMELGTDCGYTAVRMGRRLPPGAKLVSVEIEPLFAAIASKVVEHAGLSDTVKVEIGSVMTRLPSIQKKFGKRPLDALLLDHAVTDFLPDLKFLELNGMITAQTTVLCDWNLYPGTDATDLAQARHRNARMHARTPHARTPHARTRAAGPTRHPPGSRLARPYSLFYSISILYSIHSWLAPCRAHLRRLRKPARSSWST